MTTCNVKELARMRRKQFAVYERQKTIITIKYSSTKIRNFKSNKIHIKNTRQRRNYTSKRQGSSTVPAPRPPFSAVYVPNSDGNLLEKFSEICRKTWEN